jgi:hypothetical protein
MMRQQNYSCSIIANITAKEAYQKITRVSEWWSENIEGDSKKLNYIFTIHFVFGDSFEIKIIDTIPDKKIVWLVTDCNLTWVKDNREWKDTKICFEISAEKNSTKIIFTHVGLVPGIECYNGCVSGWNQYIKGSLYKLLNEGKGEPDRKK